MIRSTNLIAIAAAAMSLPTAAAGQDSAGVRVPHAKEFCFNGGRRPKCGTFVIAEMQGVMKLAQSSRLVSWNDDYSAAHTTLFEDELQWEVGLMHNVSDRWALGGAARLGPGSTGALTGLTARARRWMSEQVAVDLSAGATFIAVSAPGNYGEKAGFVGDARLNFRDDAYVGLRFEQVPVEGGTGPYGGFDAGGEQRALSLLLGVGSEWAVGGSAAVGLGLLYFLTTVGWE